MSRRTERGSRRCEQSTSSKMSSQSFCGVMSELQSLDHDVQTKGRQLKQLVEEFNSLRFDESDESEESEESDESDESDECSKHVVTNRRQKLKENSSNIQTEEVVYEKMLSENQETMEKERSSFKSEREILMNKIETLQEELKHQNLSHAREMEERGKALEKLRTSFHDEKTKLEQINEDIRISRNQLDNQFKLLQDEKTKLEQLNYGLRVSNEQLESQLKLSQEKHSQTMEELKASFHAEKTKFEQLNEELRISKKQLESQLKLSHEEHAKAMSELRASFRDERTKLTQINEELKTNIIQLESQLKFSHEENAKAMARLNNNFHGEKTKFEQLNEELRIGNNLLESQFKMSQEKHSDEMEESRASFHDEKTKLEQMNEKLRKGKEQCEIELKLSHQEHLNSLTNMQKERAGKSIAIGQNINISRDFRDQVEKLSLEQQRRDFQVQQATEFQGNLSSTNQALTDSKWHITEYSRQVQKQASKLEKVEMSFFVTRTEDRSTKHETGTKQSVQHQKTVQTLTKLERGFGAEQGTSKQTNQQFETMLEKLDGDKIRIAERISVLRNEVQKGGEN